jgi:hypothetical protein
VTALRRLLAYALATGSLLLYGAVVLASEHVYDIPTIARHGVQSLDIVEAGSGQFTEAHARSASPPTSSRGRSTTAFATFVATKLEEFCSFSGDTDVVMADGTRKRIDEVEVGDMVVATDPETGETKAREVVATLPHEDQLVTLGTSAGEIVTTEDHRYWNVTDGEWQAAQDLDPGDQLLTASGVSVVVEGLDWSTLHATTAYDLDVQGIDTFYVGAGDAEVLVHNCNLPTNIARLSDDVVRLADSHLTGSGETVLGHYADDYIGLAQSRGASYFDIGDAYNGLTPAQQWAANQRVLDAAISNGDRITLATSRLNVRPGSPLAREISYLTGPAGNYQWLDDVTLRPRG